VNVDACGPGQPAQHRPVEVAADLGLVPGRRGGDGDLVQRADAPRDPQRLVQPCRRESPRILVVETDADHHAHAPDASRARGDFDVCANYRKVRILTSL
jgi:hypothetical protein